MCWTRRECTGVGPAGMVWRVTLHKALTEEKGVSSTTLASVPGKVNIKASFPLLSCVPAKNSDYNGNNENLKQCLIKNSWEFLVLFCFKDITQACFLSSLNLLYWACALNQHSLYLKREHRKEDGALTLNVIWLASGHWCSFFRSVYRRTWEAPNECSCPWTADHSLRVSQLSEVLGYFTPMLTQLDFKNYKLTSGRVALMCVGASIFVVQVISPWETTQFLGHLTDILSWLLSTQCRE